MSASSLWTSACAATASAGQLMQAAEQLARQRGKRALELQTRIELVANHATFARMGFVEVARTAHEGFDRPTSITYRKAL